MEKTTASAQALIALILGILSFACFGMFTGIPAIILGKMELTAIKKGEAPLQGEAIAKVGLILGIIGTAIMAFFIIAAIALALLGISLTHTFMNFEGMTQSI